MASGEGQFGKNFHFFYSKKQALHYELENNSLFNEAKVTKIKKKTYAIINGKEVLYTICHSSMDDHGAKWDDIVYLGQGDFKRMGDNW